MLRTVRTRLKPQNSPKCRGRATACQPGGSAAARGGPARRADLPQGRRRAGGERVLCCAVSVRVCYFFFCEIPISIRFEPCTYMLATSLRIARTQCTVQYVLRPAYRIAPPLYPTLPRLATRHGPDSNTTRAGCASVAGCNYWRVRDTRAVFRTRRAQLQVATAELRVSGPHVLHLLAGRRGGRATRTVYGMIRSAVRQCDTTFADSFSFSFHHTHSTV